MRWSKPNRLCTCGMVEVSVICLGGRHILHQPVGHELIQDVWQAGIIMACPRSHYRLWELAVLLLVSLAGCLGLRRFWSCLDWGLPRVVQNSLHSIVPLQRKP